LWKKPNDVLRDRRLDDAARLEILRAWECNLQSSISDSDDAAASQLDELRLTRREVEDRLPAAD
jgi:hypothetical protein